jgi:hypothetical protein
VWKTRNNQASHGLHHAVYQYVKRAGHYLQRRRSTVQRWVQRLLHKMVNQTHQVKSSLPSVKWSSRIGCQGDEENYPGRVWQQNHQDHRLTYHLHNLYLDAIWQIQFRFQDRCCAHKTDTKLRNVNSKSERTSVTRTIRWREENYLYSDRASESDFKTRSRRSGPSLGRSRVLARQTETTGSKTTTKHIVIDETNISSSQSTSKRFAHRYSQSGHRHLSDEKQELTHVCLPKWQVNHQNQVQRQTHRGAGCQDRGPARGSGQKPFDSRPGKRSERLEKLVNRGKNRKRHFEERKDTFKCWDFMYTAGR